MTIYLDNYNSHIDEFDLALYKNAREALTKAMTHYKDGDLSNYFIIIVEGVKCIAHTSDEYKPLELDKIVVPFDDESIYSYTEIIATYEFKKKY